MKAAKIEQADGWSGKRGMRHKILKLRKRRAERRRAKANPECQPAYNKFRGYET